MITEFFSVPILMHDFTGPDLEQIQEEVSLVMPSIKQLDLSNPWDDTVQTTFKFGTANNLVDMFRLDKLKYEVLKAAYQMHPGYNFAVKDSWINFSNKGNFQFDHAHGDSKLSVVYYYQTNGLDGNLKFKNPNVYEFLGMGLTDRKWVYCQPQVGRLVIFPSYLEHRVDANQTDNERISITMNLV